MFKKIALALIMLACVSTFVNAQDAEPVVDEAAEGVGTFKISGEVLARGWYGSESNGADMDDDGTSINLLYKFTKYSGVQFGLESEDEYGAAPITMNNTFVYFDLLRELGVKEVGMIIQAGAFSIDERLATKGVFGSGDDRITADDVTTDRLNGFIEFNVSPEIVPLFIKVGGDLDFGYHGGNTDEYEGSGNEGAAWNNKGAAGMFEVAIMDWKVHEDLSMSIAMTGVMRNLVNDTDGDIKDTSNPQLTGQNYHFATGLGFNVLNMPRDMFLHVGGVVAYWYTEHVEGGGWDGTTMAGTTQDGVNGQAVIRLGNSAVDFGLGWVYDSEMNFGNFIGMDIKITAHKVFQPYAGFGFRPDSKENYIDGNGNSQTAINFDDRWAAEVGLGIKPVENLGFYVGWNRNGDRTAGSSMAGGNYDTTDGADMKSPTKQSGWGAVYVRVEATF